MKAAVDFDGEHMRHMSSRLERSLRPLQLDWVRAFMLSCDDAPTNLSMLTSPASLANAHTFAGFLRHAAPAVETVFLLKTLLVPCVTVDEFTVGLCIQFEGRDSAAAGKDERLPKPIDSKLGPPVFALGRFCFSTITGEMLLLSRVMDGHVDPSLSFAEYLINAGLKDEASLTSMGHKERLRLVWTGPLTKERGSSLPRGCAIQEKVAALVDRELFERGAFGESVVYGNYCGSAARFSCPDCAARALESLSLDGSAEQSAPALCQCRGHMVRPRSPLDYSAVGEGMRFTCGFWNGPSINLASSPYSGKPAVVFDTSLSIAADISIDTVVTSQLQTSAIEGLIGRARLPKLAVFTHEPSQQYGTRDLQGSGESARASMHGEVEEVSARGAKSGGCTVMVDGDRRGNESAQDVELDGERSELPRGSLPQVTASELAFAVDSGSALAQQLESDATCNALKTKEVFKREKNRAAAARCNMKRKKEVECMKEAIRASRQRLLKLMDIELELRKQNTAMRMELEAQSDRQR